jgi:hypothetical protein
VVRKGTLKYDGFSKTRMVENPLTCMVSLVAFWKKHSKDALTEETHLLFGTEAIPWKIVERIHVKQSEMGNQYMSIHFNDGSAPRSFNLEKIPDREDLIHYVEVYAEIKGYDFSMDTP